MRVPTLLVLVPALGLGFLPSGVAAAEPLPPGPWKLGTTFGLNLSQSAFSDNWAGGDRGSIVWVVNSDARAERQFSTTFNLTHLLQLAYGQAARQTGTDGSTWDRPDKTTDLIAFESTGRFTLGAFVDPYLALRLDSQFSDQSNPIGRIPFNPIKLKESAGIARMLVKTEDREVLTRLGFGLRQTFGRSFVDPVTREKSSFTSTDGGVEWQTTASWPVLEKKVLYQSTLLVFRPVFYSRSDALETFDVAARAADPGREAVADFWKATDVNFLNTFTAQITKSVGVTLVIQLVYDKFDTAANVDNSLALPVLVAEVDRNVRKAGQFKETLALTLTYQLF